MDYSDNPSEWRNKTRHTILGKWHELKKRLWSHHIEECSMQKEFESLDGKGDAWEPMSYNDQTAVEGPF